MALGQHHAVGRAVGHRQRGGLLEADAVGDADELRRAHAAALREPAVHGLAHQAAADPIDRVDEDAVADRPAGDVGAERVDLARDVEAHDHRHRDVDARHAPPREDVVIVERRGADAHDHLARSRHRVGEVLLEDQPLGAAVLVDDRRSHRDSPFSVAGAPPARASARSIRSRRSTLPVPASGSSATSST